MSILTEFFEFCSIKFDFMFNLTILSSQPPPVYILGWATHLVRERNEKKYGLREKKNVTLKMLVVNHYGM